METHARVVVIGGGVTGCAILYHLAKAGWKDVVLLERKELTAGSTWHAPGACSRSPIRRAPRCCRNTRSSSIRSWRRKAASPAAIHPVGGIHLARTDDQLTALQILHSRGKRNGIESEFISLEEARRLAPILKSDGLKAVLYEPIKGYCDPASVTQAYAKAARDRGAKIYRETPVTSTKPNPDGTWTVGTPNGDIKTDYIVNAAGLWAREVAALAGITLPLQPVEHHYMVTETIPEIAAMDHEVPNISEPSGGYYCRQEGKGLLLGAYESKCVHWAENGNPTRFRP